MAIEALALLHIPSLASSPSSAPKPQLEQLDDAIVVHTGASFSSEPEGLLEALIALVGAEALADHEDPRGILFIPHVAAPKARSYEAVVAEVGEGGVWAPFATDEGDPSLPAGFGDIGALLGGVFAELPPSLLAQAGSVAQGGPGSLEAMAAQVQALMGSSPALQNLVSELQRDPAKLQQLTQSIFGDQGDDEDK